jgi:hypothetical protein
MKITKDYLKAGNAVFKVSNPAGETVFIRVQHGRPRAGMPHPYWITSSLEDGALRYYEYVGRLLDGGRMVATHTSGHPKGSLRYNIVAWAIKCISVDTLPDGYAIEWAGRCGACGRRVTEHTNGLGAECSRKVGSK